MTATILHYFIPPTRVKYINQLHTKGEYTQREEKGTGILKDVFR